MSLISRKNAGSPCRIPQFPRFLFLVELSLGEAPGGDLIKKKGLFRVARLSCPWTDRSGDYSTRNRNPEKPEAAREGNFHAKIKEHLFSHHQVYVVFFGCIVKNVIFCHLLF